MVTGRLTREMVDGLVDACNEVLALQPSSYMAASLISAFLISAFLIWRGEGAYGVARGSRPHMAGVRARAGGDLTHIILHLPPPMRQVLALEPAALDGIAAYHGGHADLALA